MDIWLESYRWFISALFSFQGTPPNCFGCSPFLTNRLCYCIAWSFSCQAVFSAFVRQNDITAKSSCTCLTPCMPSCGDLYNDTGFSPACQHFFDFLSGKSFVLKMVSWEGLEPPTLWFVVKYSDPTELPGHVIPPAWSMVGPPGLEPGTDRLWAGCSNQLSYRPGEAIP